jgi:hypothetical protein
VNLRQFEWDEEDIPESPVAPQAHEPFVDDRGGTPEQQQAAEGRQDPHDQIEILTDHGPGGPVDEQISDSSGQSSTTIGVGTPINAQS